MECGPTQGMVLKKCGWSKTQEGLVVRKVILVSHLVGSRLIILLPVAGVDGYLELILCFGVKRRLAITTMK